MNIFHEIVISEIRRELGLRPVGAIGSTPRREWGKRAESSPEKLPSDFTGQAKLKVGEIGRYQIPNTGCLMPVAGWSEAEIPRQRGCQIGDGEVWKVYGKIMNIELPIHQGGL